MGKNALYQPPTVDSAVFNAFGMQPNLDRLNMLPRYDRKQGWIAPNALYQLARAAVSPGVAAQGGQVSPEDGINFAGNVSLGGIGASAAMKNPAPGPGRTIPATVYHGSPHRINNVDEANPNGRFDTSKIGTGEGHQAYGHGIYLAENPNVAKQYVTSVGRNLYDGKPYNNTDPAHVAASFLSGSTKADAIASLNSSIERTKGNPIQQKLLKAAKERIKNGTAAKYESLANPSLYTVDLPDDAIARMLDFNEQVPENQRQLISNAMIERFGSGASSADGGQVYKNLAWEFKNAGSKTPDADASQFLSNLGIPGIKYFDSGSRSAGNGTRNFVIFDGDTAKILKRE